MAVHMVAIEVKVRQIRLIAFTVQSHTPLKYECFPTLEKSWAVKNSNMIWRKVAHNLVWDYKMSGVGSNSCGPALKAQYRLSGNGMDWRSRCKLTKMK